MFKHIVVTALFVLAVATAALRAEDASFPQRPIRIIVNVTPGGGIDIASRVVADKLSKKFGQPVIVENKPGASGNLAASDVFRAEPDGYTLLSSFGETISVSNFLFKDLNYDPTALMPVSLLTSVPLALVVRPGFPAKDFKEFLAYLKANPGKLNYASNGIGTVAHLTAELFKQVTGTSITHVPYKGTNPVLTDLIADHVDMAFIQYSAFYDFYKSGKAKIFAVASEKRVPDLAEISTMAELGYPQIVSETWNILSAPPKTPDAIIGKLNAAIAESLTLPDVKERFATLHTTVEGGNVEDARKFVAADRARWKKVIETAGIQPE
ncbi:MAG TPA: tripartite tricarboxylate transporter substrate binding protein [Xanthobacteraceae bacterium]|jgi:tripartite-type tricarboxylate transporter receptor subunit TctC|nr:tripartite tricarboxylate transporter substrate binding protein [Xanthobacteraceae bacterium]